jgi:hypothetical protein
VRNRSPEPHTVVPRWNENRDGSGAFGERDAAARRHHLLRDAFLLTPDCDVPVAPGRNGQRKVVDGEDGLVIGVQSTRVDREQVIPWTRELDRATENRTCVAETAHVGDIPDLKVALAILSECARVDDQRCAEPHGQPTHIELAAIAVRAGGRRVGLL